MVKWTKKGLPGRRKWDTTKHTIGELFTSTISIFIFNKDLLSRLYEAFLHMSKVGVAK